MNPNYAEISLTLKISVKLIILELVDQWPVFGNEAKPSSDAKRGQNLEAEARAMRSRPRPKIIMKRYQILINNI